LTENHPDGIVGYRGKRNCAEQGAIGLSIETVKPKLEGRQTRVCLSASVVVEWYNTTHAELDRAFRMLSALKSQAADLRSPRLPKGKVGLAEPLELVIVFDSERLDQARVHDLFQDRAESGESLHMQLLPVPGATYCQQKNAGARVAGGEIVIFLDSDVIPEPGWLSSMLNAFADPGVSVVVGNTYVDSGSDVYSKSMALTWMFPMRDPVGGLSVSKWFYANNVAFRRETFLARQFEHVPGLIHAPARLMVERLERDGIVLCHLGDARALLRQLQTICETDSALVPKARDCESI